MSDKNDPDHYKSGYKNPPKHYQFKKGKSGNPGGRPKKRKHAEPENRTQVHEEEMSELFTVRNKNGKEERISARRLLYKKLKQDGLQKGDIKALKELLRLEKEHATFIPNPGEGGGVLVIPQLINLDGSSATQEQWEARYCRSLEDVLKDS